MSKVVLVTGSAQGIGAAIIKELAQNGYDCIIHYNKSKDDALLLEEEIKKYNIRTLVVQGDISKDEDVEDMFDMINQVFGGVDIVINNAAIDVSNIFGLNSIDDFKKTLDVNLLGALRVCKKAYKYMIDKKWGRIINISSTNSLNSYYPMSFEYDASKAALNSLTHNLAIQFAPYVTVNAIAPGFIGTKNELDGYDEEFLKEECEKILLKRYGKPEEVAHLVKFLVSDEASYINNSIIRIDGGQYGAN